MNVTFLNKYTGKTLDELKTSKLKELNQKCNQAILSKFNSTINGIDYQFSHDTEAQANFSSAKLAFLDGLTTNVSWTAYDMDGNVVRLTLDKTAFDSVYFSHLNHTQSNISKFRDTLMPNVESATTAEELDAIQW